MSTVRMLALASVVAVAAASPARAQLAGKFIVTPYVGAYMPSTDVGRFTGTAAGFTVKQKTAPALGANLSYWLNDRMAIEGGALYSGSDVKHPFFSETGTPSLITEHANLWLGAAKLMMQVLPPESDFNLRFGIGPAFISRSGSAYKDDNMKLTGLTDVGAAMSLCSRMALTSSTALRLRVEDYVYRTKLGFESYTTPSDNFSLDARTQNDFVVSLGFQIFLNP